MKTTFSSKWVTFPDPDTKATKLLKAAMAETKDKTKVKEGEQVEGEVGEKEEKEEKEREKETKTKLKSKRITIFCDGCFNKTTKATEKCSWGSVFSQGKKNLVEKYAHLAVPDMTLMKARFDAKGLATQRVERVIKVQFEQEKHFKQQNNSAELMAFLFGLRIANELGPELVDAVATDSKTVLDFWSKGNVGEETFLSMDPQKAEFIRECQLQRAAWEQAGGEVRFVSGDKNPADLGFHIAKAPKRKRK